MPPDTPSPAWNGVPPDGADRLTAEEMDALRAYHRPFRHSQTSRLIATMDAELSALRAERDAAITDGQEEIEALHGLLETAVSERDETRTDRDCWRHEARNATTERDALRARLSAAEAGRDKLWDLLARFADFAADAPSLDYGEDRVLSWIAVNVSMAKALLVDIRSDQIAAAPPAPTPGDGA